MERGSDNLHHGAALNFFRRQNAELHAYNRFDVRGRLLETGWHSVLEVETVIYVVSNIVLPFLKRRHVVNFYEPGITWEYIG